MSLEILFVAIAVAIAAAPLGCFVVWRRMAYFGDALSHSALLGVGVGIIFGIAEPLAIILVALLFVICFSSFRNQYREGDTSFSTDTILGILAHASLALGIMLISFAGLEAIDIHDYLFGALEAITPFIMGVMVLVAGLVIGIFIYLWNGLLLMTHSKELAHAEGINVAAHEFVLMATTATMIAVAVQIVGILPITALLIIPAASAQIIAHSPERMLVYTAGFSVLSMVAGLMLSITYNMASGPPIVAVATSLFTLTLIAKKVSSTK
ncbi:MAG: iron chelate uptake ABC transporter family permease subunit [Alphaproteobacteria bacterium]|nr:iron chelate uptake ABC transporter family permease subunit [Alphaproteobacteria bacterium]MBE8221062.1 iron chelate uptake ABC transporter family permease subunit [Alphaproteobacteria bacterium]